MPGKPRLEAAGIIVIEGGKVEANLGLTWNEMIDGFLARARGGYLEYELIAICDRGCAVCSLRGRIRDQRPAAAVRGKIQGAIERIELEGRAVDSVRQGKNAGRRVVGFVETCSVMINICNVNRIGMRCVRRSSSESSNLAGEGRRLVEDE